MMISPESFYKWELQYKTEKEILRVIVGLKKEIIRLKDVMEHPEYGCECIMHPSEATQLWCTRQYLEKAKQALEEVGGTYELTKAEQKAKEFDESIPFIEKIVFVLGGFHEGYETKTIRLDESHFYMDVDHSIILKPSNFYIIPDWPMSKEEFLTGLKELHIGEWRRKYTLDRFGERVCDGTQWELEIYYSNGQKPVRICGDNAYPYNFDELKNLFCMGEGE